MKFFDFIFFEKAIRLLSKFETGFTMKVNPDSLIEYPA